MCIRDRNRECLFKRTEETAFRGRRQNERTARIISSLRRDVYKRQVKILACEAVKKSKKLLKFTLDDGERKDRVILSGIHEYYEPEELVGKTAIAIVNLPPRKMMGIDSEGMPVSYTHLRRESTI